jgi:hypothetical protein
MLPGEIIPRHEDGLHSGMILQSLAVAVGQAYESSQDHPESEIQSLDIRGAELWSSLGEPNISPKSSQQPVNCGTFY